MFQTVVRLVSISGTLPPSVVSNSYNSYQIVGILGTFPASVVSLKMKEKCSVIEIWSSQQKASAVGQNNDVQDQM